MTRATASTAVRPPRCIARILTSIARHETAVITAMGQTQAFACDRQTWPGTETSVSELPIEALGAKYRPRSSPPLSNPRLALSRLLEDGSSPERQGDSADPAKRRA